MHDKTDGVAKERSEYPVRAVIMLSPTYSVYKSELGLSGNDVKSINQ